MNPRELWQTVSRAGSLGRIAWTLRGLRRAEDEATRSKAREALARHLGAAGGLPMKAGQFLAGFDADGPMRTLVTGVPPRPWTELAPYVSRSLGRPLEEVFAQVDPEGLTASLGQVHRARLHDGNEVAVKVQLPGIRDAVSAELRLAGLVPGVGPARRWGIDLDGYKTMLRETLDRELDYRGESERQHRLGQHLSVPGLVVPKVHREWCAPTLLVQDWEPGEPLAVARGWPRGDRLELGRILLETTLRGLFVAGELHADPHEGNLRVRRTDSRPEVVLYDFGCTLTLSPGRRRALLKLLASVRDRDASAVRPCLEACGFDGDKLAHLDDTLPELVGILLEPFTQSGAFDVGTWDVSARTSQLLGELRWWFRSAGPPDLLLLMRALHGLARQLQLLEATLPWWALLERVVGEEAMADARRWQPDALRPAPPRLQSRLLRVSIHDGAQESLALALPAHEAFDLPRAMPETVLEKLAAHGIDLDALSRRIRETSAAPQDVLRLDDDERSYRVWLE